MKLSQIHAMKMVAAILPLLLAGGMAASSAESWGDELEFSSAVEESLSHYHAFELNLDAGNTELAAAHAAHPALELYPVMSPHLQAYPELAERLRLALLDVPSTAGPGAERADAQAAVDAATALLEEARLLVAGGELSSDDDFKLALTAGLLGTAGHEYGEAVSGGEIINMVEFQDSSAFVWRSQQILKNLDLPDGDLERVMALYAEIQGGFDSRSDPSLMTPRFDALAAALESNMDAGPTARGDIAPPLKQLNMGVDPADIQCIDGLGLLFSPSGRPACISEKTAPMLQSEGWTS
ncbi:conserved hypothetical protein [Cenarchaeum symbiosum A]|uniref:Uncharacterized protein n=1 Tax=Cenarchaeum symbiosum (strain A) TaxID=414004 RepID=A0RV41_CENSY|nr:conserved hypothetical protein [Cenarchaeum symbiosum A]